MAIKPTTTEVIAEGQFIIGYFPNCADNTAFEARIQAVIDSATSEVKHQVGATNYASTDADTIVQIHDCTMYLACARLWQIIRGVMVGYDAESLPPEFVNAGDASEQRDWYMQIAAGILNQYDNTPGPQSYVGSFVSGTTD